MPVPSTIADLSTTANSNSPASGEAVGPNLDNYLRAHAAIIKRKGDEFPSVKDSGAVGDGVTDDAAAIQAAIDAIYAAGGGELYFPVGDYLIGTALDMKRNVSLRGPDQRLSAGQMYESNSEAEILGIARILPTSAITTAAIKYDFTLASRVARPYGAAITNLVIDSRNQSSGDCLSVIPPPTGEGPFDTGWASGAIRVDNVYFLRAPRYGASVVSTATEKTNAWFRNCRFAFNGSHGLYAYYCFDIQLDHCFSFANVGDGVYLELCGTERVLFCDIFDNDGHGITSDGYNGRYVGGFSQINGKHGMNIIASTSTVTNKKYRIFDFVFDGNSVATTETYSHIFIGSRGGVSCANVHIFGSSFGDTASGGTNRVKHIIEQDVLANTTGNYMTNCIVAHADLKSGNDPFNDNFWQSTNFENCIGSDGNVIEQKYHALPASSGSYSPNTIRGVKFYKTANTTTANITGITNGTTYIQNREVWILIDDVNTSVDFSGTTLFGNGGVDLLAPCNGTIIHARNVDGTNWDCVVYGKPTPEYVYNFAGPSTQDTSATLTAGQLKSLAVRGTPAGAINYTLPTGTDLDASFTIWPANMAFEWSVINLSGANTITLLTNTGHTISGNAVVAVSSSARFLSRKSAANTVVTYRIG